MTHRYSDDDLERMLDACLEAADDPAGPEFTEWEHGFLDDLAEKIAGVHLSDRQVEKLEQIYAEKVAP